VKHNLPFHDLDEELQKWFGGLPNDEVVTLEEWIEGSGSLRELAGYALILWPDFMEHQDCVFRKDIAKHLYDEMLAQLKGDKSAVEAFLNHVHVATHFFGSTFHDPPTGDEKSPSKELVIHVGKTLAKIWLVKLKHDFPNRDFEVRFVAEDAMSVLDYELTFFQKRKSNEN
jgi:hypothetical protein